MTLTASAGEATRSDSERVPGGSVGPGRSCRPRQQRGACASAGNGAEPSLVRQPCISASADAGTPSAGTVTLPPPFR